MGERSIMSRAFDSQAPKAYLRLCETRALQGHLPALNPPLGEVIRVLSASRPGGVFLCLGQGAGETGAWILDGMDLSSRLVVVVEDGLEADMLRSLLGDDLRVTVHVQDALSFLGDVRDHRFDLITDLSPGECAELTRLALERLALGAFYMTRHPAVVLTQMLCATATAAEGQEAVLDPNAFVLAHLPGALAVSLIVHRPQKPQAKRRGGRRAREGITPLFSSRPRSTGD